MQSNSQQTLQVSIDALKQAAGFRAADCITDGMVVGLGSGSTARHATLRVAARLSEGSLADIVAIPTSDETERLARERGIPLTTLDDHPRIDITIDAQGQFYVNERELVKHDAETLKRAMLKVADGETDLPVLVSGDRNAPLQSMMTVLDVAAQLGMSHLSFVARQHEPED